MIPRWVMLACDRFRIDFRAQRVREGVLWSWWSSENRYSLGSFTNPIFPDFLCLPVTPPSSAPRPNTLAPTTPARWRRSEASQVHPLPVSTETLETTRALSIKTD